MFCRFLHGCAVVLGSQIKLQPLHLPAASTLSQAAAAGEAEGSAPAKRRRRQEGDKPKKKVGRSSSSVLAYMTAACELMMGVYLCA